MRVYFHGEVTQPGLCVSPKLREEKWKRCPDAGLMDGCVPTIGNCELASTTGLEPAVWFKVLVIDAVCIDFITNSLLWTTCRYKLCTQRIMGDNRFQRCKHVHECLLNEDFHLPDVDLDRGLELAKHILVRQKDDDLVDLLHLLHVYILPIIRLHSEDKEHVTEALTNQKLVIKRLDTQIDQMSDQRTKTREDMKKWREDICQGLQTEKAIVSCNSVFLKLLCTHLEVDIRDSYVELDACQKKVEEAKLKVLRKEGDHYISHLKVRSQRDEVAECITKSLFVVEEVGMMLRLSKSPDNQKLNEMHTAYIKTQEGWESYTKELTELQRKKVCATSVREALVTTAAELKSGADTTGIEYISTGTEQSTDVLGPNHLPSGWETLQSQVAKSLDLNPVIRQLHYDFNVWIRRYCVLELEDQPHGSNWMEKIPTLNCTQVEDSSNVSCLRVSPDKFSRLRQSIKEKKPSAHFQGLTKTLQNEVFLHFQQVVDNLVKDPAVPSTCFSRLWTSYERCFFSSRGRDILRLYERAYASETKTLKTTLPEVTVRDLELDDEWILNILGLYAPDFQGASVAHDFEQLAVQPQVGEEARETDRQDDERQPRERLESGIDIHDDDGVVHRRKVPRTSGRRNSNRFTKIIDLMWVGTQPQSERSSTWSGLERRSRGSSKFEDTDALSAASSAPDVKSPTGFNQGHSIPINIPNTNSNARTYTPITSLVGDSGVCLNKDGESLETTGYHDPLGHSCQDNPNIRVFLERFQTAYHCFRVVLQDTVPMAKLQWLYRCIQQVNSTAEKQSQLIFCGKCRMLSGDDLLTSLILFLLHGDIDEVASGYHQLILLQDYLPDFLDKGHFGFTVLQFLLAYSYILRYAEEKEKAIDP